MLKQGILELFLIFNKIISEIKEQFKKPILNNKITIMKKKEQPFDETKYYLKVVIAIFVIGLMVFLSAPKSSDSDSGYSGWLIFGWVIISIITFIIYVFVARWVFKINDIVSNQEKTNQLLESINKSLSNKNKEQLPEGDVNDPEYMKKIINNLK